ncbi:FecR family protein [Steroidobacter sp.]|uniref:FecR family protein n=1 Tax=Steroidobacter sp. TaxID=1978227 RepID=UPI001A59B76E|nr:FecR domain-containing protein [Steroidobacter sp.]MBL8266527.1 FecR domain-containing protein [Steroidobacter sp.]
MKRTVEVAHLDAAWRWVLRLRDEQATPEDLAEWLQWYEADESHRAAFEEMQSFWHETGHLVAGDEEAEVAALLAGRVSAQAQPVLRPWWQRPVAALAASVLIATVAVGWVLSSQRSAPVSTTVDVRETWLPDGSTIELAAKSAVNSRYTDSTRLLVMEGETGEAYFSVARNPKRPFIVQVGTMRVQALGTAFNVRRADDRVVVSVTKGLVEVSVPRADGSGEPVKVGAGNRIVWEVSGDSTPTIVPATAASTLAWKQGRLEYHNEPLAAVIADVNRYSRQPIVIEDEAAGRILFSGTVFTRATDVWIESLPQVFPVRLEPRLLGGLYLKSRD